jgi:hypothetical protein
MTAAQGNAQSGAPLHDLQKAWSILRENCIEDAENITSIEGVSRDVLTHMQRVRRWFAAEGTAMPEDWSSASAEVELRSGEASDIGEACHEVLMKAAPWYRKPD